MTLTPEGFDTWLQVLRRFALAIIGGVGLIILLLKYWTSGDISLPAFAAFAALLGLNSLSIGRGSAP